MFIDDDQAKQAVAAQLMQEPTALPAAWDTIIPAANNDAYRDIQAALLGRGFSQAQVDAWDRGAAFQTDLASFWSFSRAGVLSPLDAVALRNLDRRKELLTAVVTVDGVVVNPGTSAGQASYGGFDYTNDLIGDPACIKW